MENSQKKAQTGRKYSGKVSQPKKSIMHRWAIGNALFVFVTFMFFAIVIYQIVVNSLVDTSKMTMVEAMNRVENQLNQADVALSEGNLNQFLAYRANQIENVDGSLVQTAGNLSDLIGNTNSHFFIYNLDKKLIFTTSRSYNTQLHADTQGRTLTIRDPKGTSFLKSTPIWSKKTGKVIGYLQSFYDLSNFFKLRDRLVLSVAAAAIIVIMAVIVFGYMMSDHFIKPLRWISRSMQKVTSNPEAEFEPVILHQEDEVQQIADFYNMMMTRLNTNFDLQKQFVSDVSHELRTPLAVIDGNLQMLMRWGLDDRELVEENIRISHEEAERMKNLLQDMLDLSRLESSTEGVEEDAECDVTKSCLDAIRNFKILHEDFEISLDNKLTEARFANITDQHYLQALNILLDNAAKYSPDQDKSVKVTLLSDEDFIITCVADKGQGIPREDLERIFERFFRADKARNREIGGTGLGLPIIANILKRHRGEITVNSEVNEGSTFIFKIPKVRPV